MNEFEHYGVKGMRWGVRKQKQVTSNSKYPVNPPKFSAAQKAQLSRKKSASQIAALERRSQRRFIKANNFRIKHDKRWEAKLSELPITSAQKGRRQVRRTINLNRTVKVAALATAYAATYAVPAVGSAAGPRLTMLRNGNNVTGVRDTTRYGTLIDIK